MAKIGVFDSGVGGLSVLKRLIEALPCEEFFYYADNANCPYGEKSAEFITGRACEITEHLLEEGCNLIVVACNTATAAAIATLRSKYSVPFIGMEPAVKPAALNTKTGVIGVLATAGTLSASKYLSTKGLYEDNITIAERVGQGFVELVEKGELEGAEAKATVSRSLTPLLEAGADKIVLGCTHYPFLSGLISEIAEEYRISKGIDYEIELIDPAPAVAKQVIHIMEKENIARGSDCLTIIPEASGDTQVLLKLLGSIFG